jgi:hypothetical protein
MSVEQIAMLIIALETGAAGVALYHDNYHLAGLLLLLVLASAFIFSVII